MSDQKTFSRLSGQVLNENAAKESITLSTYLKSYKDMFTEKPAVSVKPEKADSNAEEKKPEEENNAEPPLDCPCRLKKLLEGGEKKEETNNELNLNEFSFQTGFFGLPNYSQNLNTIDFNGSSFNSFSPSYSFGNQFGSSLGFGFF